MEFEAFLKEYGIYISLGLFGLIVLFLIFYFVYPRLKQEKTEEIKVVDPNQFYLALGGEDNITKLSMTGSRLSVELNDMGKYQEEQLKTLGVIRIIVMKSKLVLLVDETFKTVIKTK